MKSLSQTHSNHPAAQIAQRLQNRQMPKIIQLDHVNLQVARDKVDDFKHKHQKDIQDWQVAIIKTPHQSYNIDEDPILIINERHVVKPINEVSILVNAISDKFENTAFLSVDFAILDNKNVQKLIRDLI
jgi:hypothetical protein